MVKIREYKGIIILILVILATTFYWYELRPVQREKKCIKGAREIATLSIEDGGDPDVIFNEAYYYCMNIPFLTPKLK